jgi:hypothetical protein
MSRRIYSFVALALAAAGSAFGQASFQPLGYSENFDSMGTAGTAAPTGWRHFATSFGSNATWTSSVTFSGANSVATDAVTRTATTLVATNNPTANQNNGYNAARSTSATSDRVLASAPTTVAGGILQLQLRNDTALSLPAGFQLTIRFDTVRFSSVSSANQLPGYWLGVSQNAGSTWTNVGPNPTIATVPNSVGVTSSTLTYTLSSTWNIGSSIYFRWVDDNAQETSPDQIIGLNNVSIVPTPGAAMLFAAAGLVGIRRRR